MKRPPDLIDVGLKRYAIASSDEYPFSWPALRTLRRLPFHPAVTFFVGENGSGKSTLLEAIAVACGFHAEGGSRNFRFKRAPRTRHCTTIWSSTSASPA
jgi:predicted ATPase